MVSGTLLAFRTGAALAGALPASASTRIAETAAVAASRVPSWFGPLAPLSSRRELVRRHLQRVVGSDVEPRLLSRMVDDTFGSYAAYWAESLRLPGVAAADVASGIRYEGFEHIDSALAAGRGVILALPHLGGWEWAGADLAHRGYSMSVVVERLARDDVFDWFVDFREKLGFEVIATGPGSAARCSRALGDNHVLCLLCDRLVGGSAGVQVDFFGETTGLPAGPAMLSIRAGAPVLPVGVSFDPKGVGHLGLIRPAVARPADARLRSAVQSMTQALARELEWLIRRNPTQWHMLQPNWPSDPGWKGEPPDGSAGKGEPPDGSTDPARAWDPPPAGG